MFIDFRNRGGGEGPSVNVEALTVTANGKYEAPEGTAYSPVDVNVAGGPEYDWSGTGYETADIEIADANDQKRKEADIEYARQKFEDWETGFNKTNISDFFINDKNLVYAPKIDTSKVTDMQSCFEGCMNLTSVPSLDTSNVSNMAYCFQNCASLISIPQLNTSKVYEMTSMFKDCTNLTSVPLLDASKVASMGMEGCFNGCVNLTDLGGFTGLKVSLNLYDWGYLKKLTKQSILNVINNLGQADPAFEASPVLKIGSTNLAKLTAEEIAVGTAKGWLIGA